VIGLGAAALLQRWRSAPPVARGELGRVRERGGDDQGPVYPGPGVGLTVVAESI